MGPSGAGKTTLLNTVAGKAYYGVFINILSHFFNSRVNPSFTGGGERREEDSFFKGFSFITFGIH